MPPDHRRHFAFQEIMKKHSIIPSAFHTAGTQIASLSAAHFMVDMLGGLLPGFLPIALEHFKINLGMGVIILTSMSIGCNIMQIPASMLGRETRKPWLLSLGLLMSGLIVLLAAMPSTTPVFVLCFLMVIVGAGIAIVHPHGLRGTQHIGKIAASVTTPTFMTGGFLGSAVGPWISALLVGHYGLKGLYWMIPPILLILLSLRLSNVKLAPDDAKPSGRKEAERNPEPETAAQPAPDAPWSFWNLFLIATLLNTGTVTIQALLPSYLVKLDFTLPFGGFSAMLFGIGSAIGSITIGFLVRKHRCAPFVLNGLALGIPTLLLYFLIAHYSISCLLIMLGGLLASSCYPLLVSMSRNAAGSLPMSTRMGLIVGGTWGIAGVALLVIGQIASRIGLAPVMHLSWIFYSFTLIAALLLLKRKPAEPAAEPEK